MDAKTLCLGALTLGDASGYEIKKLVEEGCFAHFHASSFGSIYPALAQLSAEGAVTFYVDSQEGRPDRKVYRLTQAGRERFRRALHVPPAPDRVRSDAVFMLFFAELLEPRHLARVYDDYAAHYRHLVDRMESLDDDEVPPGRLWGRGFGLAFYRAAADYMEKNRHLLIGGGDEGGEATSGEQPSDSGEAAGVAAVGDRS